MNYTSCTSIHYICLLHNYCKIILPYNIIQLQAGNWPHLTSSTFLKSSPRQHFSPKVHKRYVNLPEDNPGRKVCKKPSQKEKEMGRVMCFRGAHCTCNGGGGVWGVWGRRGGGALPLPSLSGEKPKAN